MALIHCPECKAQVSDQAPACVQCGYPLSAAAEAPPPQAVPPPPLPGGGLKHPRLHRSFYIAVGVLALFLFLANLERTSVAAALGLSLLAGILWIGIGSLMSWGAKKWTKDRPTLVKYSPLLALPLCFLTLGMFVPSDKGTAPLGFASQASPRKPAVDHKAVARSYAEQTGRQVMNHIGGGQDLLVDVLSLELDATGQKYLIEMAVSFNGSLIRSNNYQVTGRLTVGTDGKNPSFARRQVNQLYKDQEVLKGTFQVLEALSESSAKSR